jgi:DNA-binding FadR family transcriptional regulator
MSAARDLVASPAKAGELVARDIRSRIANGEYLAGDRLPPEDVLMATLGLSRMTVREGLRILESQGLIEVRRGRGGGPRITHPSVAHLAPSLALTLQLQHVTYRDLYEASQLIEPALAGRLALTHSAADIAAMNDIVQRADDAALAGDRTAFAAAAADMHEAVTTRGGNKTLATFAGLMHELISHYYAFAVGFTEAQDYYERAVKSYRKFVRLVSSGDAAAAEKHWEQQLAVTNEGMDERDRPISFL